MSLNVDLTNVYGGEGGGGFSGYFRVTRITPVFLSFPNNVKIIYVMILKIYYTLLMDIKQPYILLKLHTHGIKGFFGPWLLVSLLL
jgi:hypothetical protein